MMEQIRDITYDVKIFDNDRHEKETIRGLRYAQFEPFHQILHRYEIEHIILEYNGNKLEI